MSCGHTQALYTPAVPCGQSPFGCADGRLPADGCPKSLVWSRLVLPRDSARGQCRWATQILTGYNKSLCKLTLKAHQELDCPTPESDKDLYAGTETCRGCHAAAYAVYEKTSHSHAWKTLQDKGKDCDVGCIGCHSVGFEKPGGYCRLQDVKPFVNVGCENCHGPAKSHSLNPGDRSQWSSNFTRTPTESTCIGCHNEEHSDQFDFETYLPKVLGPGHQAAGADKETILPPQ